MATNFPGLDKQEPILSLFDNSFNVSKSNFCNFDNVSKFIELGGFDETFSPFYFEDVDLSYRAWKKGLQCLYTEHCKIEHFHQSVFRLRTTKKSFKEYT